MLASLSFKAFRECWCAQAEPKEFDDGRLPAPRGPISTLRPGLKLRSRPSRNPSSTTNLSITSGSRIAILRESLIRAREPGALRAPASADGAIRYRIRTGCEPRSTTVPAGTLRSCPICKASRLQGLHRHLRTAPDPEIAPDAMEGRGFRFESGRGLSLRSSADLGLSSFQGEVRPDRPWSGRGSGRIWPARPPGSRRSPRSRRLFWRAGGLRAASRPGFAGEPDLLLGGHARRLLQLGKDMGVRREARGRVVRELRRDLHNRVPPPWMSRPANECRRSYGRGSSTPSARPAGRKLRRRQLRQSYSRQAAVSGGKQEHIVTLRLLLGPPQGEVLDAAARAVSRRAEAARQSVSSPPSSLRLLPLERAVGQRLLDQQRPGRAASVRRAPAERAAPDRTQHCLRAHPGVSCDLGRREE
jgi:hypothetical protein